MPELRVSLTYSPVKASGLNIANRKELAKRLRLDLATVKVPHPPEANIAMDGHTVRFWWFAARCSPIFKKIKQAVYRQSHDKASQKAQKKCAIESIILEVRETKPSASSLPQRPLVQRYPTPLPPSCHNSNIQQSQAPVTLQKKRGRSRSSSPSCPHVAKRLRQEVAMPSCAEQSPRGRHSPEPHQPTVSSSRLVQGARGRPPLPSWALYVPEDMNLPSSLSRKRARSPSSSPSRHHDIAKRHCGETSAPSHVSQSLEEEELSFEEKYRSIYGEYPPRDPSSTFPFPFPGWPQSRSPSPPVHSHFPVNRSSALSSRDSSSPILSTRFPGYRPPTPPKRRSSPRRSPVPAPYEYAFSPLSYELPSPRFSPLPPSFEPQPYHSTEHANEAKEPHLPVYVPATHPFSSRSPEWQVEESRGPITPEYSPNPPDDASASPRSEHEHGDFPGPASPRYSPHSPAYSLSSPRYSPHSLTYSSLSPRPARAPPRPEEYKYEARSPLILKPRRPESIERSPLNSLFRFRFPPRSPSVQVQVQVQAQTQVSSSSSMYTNAQPSFVPQETPPPSPLMLAGLTSFTRREEPRVVRPSAFDRRREEIREAPAARRRGGDAREDNSRPVIKREVDALDSVMDQLNALLQMASGGESLPAVSVPERPRSPLPLPRKAGTSAAMNNSNRPSAHTDPTTETPALSYGTFTGTGLSTTLPATPPQLILDPRALVLKSPSGPYAIVPTSTSEMSEAHVDELINRYVAPANDVLSDVYYREKRLRAIGERARKRAREVASRGET